MKKISLFILLVICSLFYNCGEDTYISNEVEETISTDIRVDIKGAVRYPGVYIIPSNYLLKDLINVAGGLLDSANSNMINMVLPLSDNQMINIPYLENENIKNLLININTATISDLTSLPSIGTSKAEKIIKYRNEHGSFKSIEEIKNVSGIGNDVFNQIKAYITV